MNIVNKTSPQGVNIEYIEPDGLTLDYEFKPTKAVIIPHPRKLAEEYRKNLPNPNTGD